MTKYLYFAFKLPTMISKAKSKFIKSLQIKKYRKQEQCFVVEGRKSILELFNSDFEARMIVATEEFMDQYRDRVPDAAEKITVKPDELKGLGEFQSNEAGLAVAKIKPNTPIVVEPAEFALVLDDIRDPGNLGTIVRTADWYGIHKIIASPECADIYNSKVITATMGSFTRVKIFYTDLATFLHRSALPAFGTFLSGENIHSIDFGVGGLIVIGNEAQGISEAVEQYVIRRITIPRFGDAESLNAAIATSIVLDNLRRV